MEVVLRLLEAMRERERRNITCSYRIFEIDAEENMESLLAALVYLNTETEMT